MRTLTLRRGEERRLRAGHLWIFSNEIDVKKTPLKDFAPGEEATVRDSRGIALGSACVSPGSLICARLYARKPDVPLDAELLRQRLAQALQLRERLFDAPFYRLAYGEGDFLPGLVIDRFGSHLALQVTTAGMEVRKDLVRQALEDLVHPSSLAWDNAVRARELEQLSLDPVQEGACPNELDVPEGGCSYLAPCLGGQKTGWYYDQRPNRAMAAAFCRPIPDADVLDAFSYVGGFGVACGRAGARTCVFADASEQALGYCSRNLERNAPRTACEPLAGDAFETLGRLRADGRRFDLVSIDPPAFIKRRKDMKGGLAAYARINQLALGLVRDGGVLVSSSCSQHLAMEDLRAAVARATAKAGAHARLLFAGGQGPDHPVHCAMPETAYLKCLAVQISR